VLVATVIASGAAQAQLICPASAGLFLCALSSLLVSARTAEPQLDVRFGSMALIKSATEGLWLFICALDGDPVLFYWPLPFEGFATDPIDLLLSQLTFT
jgi:hypothetical protein